MKKLISLVSAILLTVSVQAANERTSSFLNGYNVYITTNTAAFVGFTNVLYTSINGAIVNSLSSNGGNTNVLAASAFKVGGVPVVADALGDIAANASITVMLNYTNLIPITATNSQGQLYVTNWVLAPTLYPTYQYPATTNVYPTLPTAASTNTLTLNFQRGWNVNGSQGNPYFIWDSVTNTFSMTIGTGAVGPGPAPLTITSNLPTSWTTGASTIRLYNVTAANTATSIGGSAIISQVLLRQPAP